MEDNENLEEKINDEIQIYPNPTTGELRVTSDGLRIEKAEVFDIVGKLQKAESRKQNGEIIIDISHLATGLYFITITDENKVKTTKKVVKE